MDIQCNTATVTTQYLVSPTQSDAPMLCQRGTYAVRVCHHHDLVGVGENTQQLGVAPVVGLGSTLLIDRLYGRHSLDQTLNTHTHTLNVHTQHTADWEINVPYQHKNEPNRGQGLGWRFSSARLRMANDTVTSRPRCLSVQRRPKIRKDREGSFKLLC